MIGEKNIYQPQKQHLLETHTHHTHYTILFIHSRLLKK